MLQCLSISLQQELLEDPAIISAIDEETEFNALVVCTLCFSSHMLLPPFKKDYLFPFSATL